ncbi:MAG TPA: GNAT family N-acetyltransferase [Candidatus Saccharimonadales bacterium]|nr:GNAT family N-acetyltransferase [Candidatus Saccharimonadales bacterium]
MTNPGELPSPKDAIPSFKLETFDPSKTSWRKARKDVIDLEKANFGDNGDDEKSLREGFVNTQNTIVVVKDEDRIIGYTLAKPAQVLYEEESDWEAFRGREASTDTAYIYNTVLAPEYQGKGYVAQMYAGLDQALLSKGYKRIHRDSAVENGLAANILKNNQGKIISNFEHDSPYGRQMFIDMWIQSPSEANIAETAESSRVFLNDLREQGE